MASPESLITAVVGVLLLASPAAHAGGAGEPVLFTTIAEGSRSGIRTLTQVVIHTPTEWRDLWQKHSTGLAGAGVALPVVDFSRHMVVAVFAGEVTKGTRASILKILQEKNRLVVLVRITDAQPGPALAEPGTATPFHIVRIHRSNLPVVFSAAKVPDIY